MNVRKVINKAIRHRSDGGQVVGDVNAVVAANVGRKGSGTAASSRQSTRIVQRSGQTRISESSHDHEEGGAK